jgi:D-inositol-3-phosphate glycosyltransferase
MGKNIVMFSPEYWCKNNGKVLSGSTSDIEIWGGMGRVVSDVSEAISNQGYDVTVFARRKGNNVSPIFDESYYKKENIVHYQPVKGVNVFGVPPCSGLGDRIQKGSWKLYEGQPRDCVVNWDGVFTTMNYIYDFNEDIRRKLEDTGNTVVHGHDFFGSQFIYNLKTSWKLPDLKSVLSVHMSNPRDKNLIEADERLQWENKGCKLADKVHAVSNYQRNLVIEKYQLRSEKVIAIPNGVNTDIFRPMTTQDEASDREIVERYMGRKPYVIFWGRMEPVKGVGELVRGFAESSLASDHQLGIFAMPSNESYCKSVMRVRDDLPSNVREKVKIHMGKIDGIPVLARNAALSVFPSYEESFGLVAIESLASGIPIVVTNTGGFKETVNEKVGVLIDRPSPSSIKGGLEQAIANRENLAQNARPHAEKYSWNSLAQRYIRELYD